MLKKLEKVQYWIFEVEEILNFKCIKFLVVLNNIIRFMSIIGEIVGKNHNPISIEILVLRFMCKSP